MLKAQSAGLDLVLMPGESQPPVAKILNYSHFLYEAQRKARAHARVARGPHTQVVRIGPTIADHDYQTKLDLIRRLLSRGHKVKVSVTLRGRLITHPELASRLLERVLSDLEDAGSAPDGAAAHGREISLLLSPVSQQ